MSGISEVLSEFVPRFSGKYDFGSEASTTKKVAIVAGNTFVLAASFVSFFKNADYFFYSIVSGALLYNHIRYAIILSKDIFVNSSTIVKVCFLGFLFLYFPKLLLGVPLFLGSYIAFHAHENKAGDKSYFTAPFESTPYLFRLLTRVDESSEMKNEGDSG